MRNNNDQYLELEAENAEMRAFIKYDVLPYILDVQNSEIDEKTTQKLISTIDELY